MRSFLTACLMLLSASAHAGSWADFQAYSPQKISSVGAVHLTDGSNIGSVGATQATASISVVANQIVLVAVQDFWFSGDAGITVPTLSGCGTTGTQIGHVDKADTTTTNWVSTTVFSFIPPSSMSCVLTIAWAASPFGSPGSMVWNVDTFTGSSGTINQVVTGSSNGTTATGLSIAMGSLASGSASYGAFTVQGSSTTVTAGTGYTALGNNNNFGIWIGSTEYQSPGTTTVAATSNNAADWSGVAVEIGAAGGTPVPVVIASAQPMSALPLWCSNVHQFENLITPTQMVQLSQAIGVNCLRDSPNWDQVESSAGVYNWSGPGFDTEWSTICAAGIYPIILFTYNNPLYASGIFTPITAGSNTTAFNNYAVAGVNHYIGSSFCPNGFAAEITNEPNNTSFFSPAWVGSAFATLAASTASAIKAAQSSKVVVITGGLTPGFTYTPNQFAASMTTVTVSAADYWGSHPYNYTEGAPTQTLTPAQLLLDLASLTASFGTQVKPLAITEYNFPANALNDGLCTTAATNNLQGVYTFWGAANAAYAQQKFYGQYDLVNDGTPCTATDQNTFGYYTNPADGLSPKPAAVCQASMSGPASGGLYTGALTGASNYDIWAFPGEAVKQLNFHFASGKLNAVIWQDVPGATQAAPAGAINFSENFGSFSSASAVDCLRNSVPVTIAGPVITVPLSQAVGGIILTVNP